MEDEVLTAMACCVRELISVLVVVAAVQLGTLHHLSLLRGYLIPQILVHIGGALSNPSIFSTFSHLLRH